MGLYDEVSSYVHHICLSIYMMNVSLDLCEVPILFMLVYEVNYGVFGPMIDILSMCEVMGFTCTLQ